MNLFETGVISGAPTGAIIGGVICKSHGASAIVGGSLAGLISGAVCGWLYAILFICLSTTIGVLWQAARKRPNASPTDKDLDTLTTTGIRGIVLGILGGAVVWACLGWLAAVTTALVVTLATAVVAVARCESR